MTRDPNTQSPYCVAACECNHDVPYEVACQMHVFDPQGSGGVCGGSPNGCRGTNYSIETDSEVSWPNTGRMVEVSNTEA